MDQWSPEVFTCSSQVWLNCAVSPIFTNATASLNIALLIHSPVPHRYFLFQHFFPLVDHQVWQNNPQKLQTA